MKKIDIQGTKTWNDGNDQDGTRPDSITVNLLANGNPIREAEVKPDADGNWKYSFPDLPKYGEGKEIRYTVTEDAVTGYSTEIEGYDINNSYTPGKTSVTVTKNWNDSRDKDGIRPDSIRVQLYADGEKEGKAIELKAGSEWTYTWYLATQNRMCSYPDKEHDRHINQLFARYFVHQPLEYKWPMSV